LRRLEPDSDTEAFETIDGPASMVMSIAGTTASLRRVVQPAVLSAADPHAAHIVAI
jgi:hypothetical protein